MPSSQIYTFGARNDSDAVAAFQERFYTEVFFPYIDKHKIKDVFLGGDTFDRRKYSNHKTLYRAKQMLFEELAKRNINTVAIIGNHDAFFKNSNEVNTVELACSEYTNIKIIKDPEEVEIGKTKILMLPWICADNYDKSLDLIKQTNAQCVLGHLELAGFEMYKGYVTEHGMNHKLFERFDVVMSGHYHHKSTSGNINYLGSPYEMTWSDFNDDRGFHIFDTKTRALDYHVNPLKLFHRLIYDDRDKTLEQVLDVDVTALTGAFVKLVVHEKNNPYWFDMLVDKIEKAAVSDLKIVDDSLKLAINDDDDTDLDTDDTISIIMKYAESNLQEKNPLIMKDLNLLLRDLYNEALQVEQTV